MKKSYDVSVLNTICNATKERQTEAERRNNPSLEVVMKIHKACDYISLDWLLYGEGQMDVRKTM